jgi:hypothetical protein
VSGGYRARQAIFLANRPTPCLTDANRGAVFSLCGNRWQSPTGRSLLDPTSCGRNPRTSYAARRRRIRRITPAVAPFATAARRLARALPPEDDDPRSGAPPDKSLAAWFPARASVSAPGPDVSVAAIIPLVVPVRRISSTALGGPAANRDPWPDDMARSLFKRSNRRCAFSSRPFAISSGEGFTGAWRARDAAATEEGRLIG